VYLNAQGYVYDISFSSDGKYLACVAQREVVIWRADTHPFYHHVVSLQAETQQMSLAFSQDSAYLVAAGQGATAILYEVNSFKPLASVREALYGVAFSPDGAMLAGAANSSASVWDVRALVTKWQNVARNIV